LDSVITQILYLTKALQITRSNKKAVLSQGEPSDAAVNFDTY